MKQFIAFLRSRVFLINLGLAFVAVVVIVYLSMQWLKSSRP